MRVCELLAQLKTPHLLVRTAVDTPQNVIKTRRYIKQAFQNQIDGKGFSLVEIVTSCPTNWGYSAIDSLTFLREQMFQEFPVGVFRDKDKEEA